MDNNVVFIFQNKVINSRIVGTLQENWKCLHSHCFARDVSSESAGNIDAYFTQQFRYVQSHHVPSAATKEILLHVEELQPVRSV